MRPPLHGGQQCLRSGSAPRKFDIAMVGIGHIAEIFTVSVHIRTSVFRLSSGKLHH